MLYNYILYNHMYNYGKAMLCNHIIVTCCIITLLYRYIKTTGRDGTGQPGKAG